MNMRMRLFLICLAVILFSTAGGLGLRFALAAWQEPTAAPPDNNVPGPVNIGSGAQTKAGSLNIGGVFTVVGAGSGAVIGAPSGGNMGEGSLNAQKLCIEGNCRTTWPDAVSAFVDEGNVGFGPTAVLGTNDNTPLSFEINNVGRMYIDTAGNVGIGTTSPGAVFEVNGNISSNAVSNVIKSGSSSGDYSIAMYSNAASGIIQVANYAHTGNVLPLLLNPSGGNVGIGTATPNYKLVVAGASPREYIWATSGNPELDLGDGTNHWSIYRDTATDQLRFWRTDNRMTITNGGNVGIGTTSPSYRLHVTGSGSAPDFVGVHSEVTSTADDAIGVRGMATSTGAIKNYGGVFVAAGSGALSTGVYGVASGAGQVYGVIGEATNTGAVKNYGGYFTAYGTGSDSTAVFGRQYATTGGTYGGDFYSSSNAGVGIRGRAPGDGAVYGVRGDAGSAAAVPNAGGYFTSYGTSGSKGVWAAANGVSGINYGVYGQVVSAAGWAGYFTGGKGVFTPQLCLGTEGNCRTDWPGSTSPGGIDAQVQFNDGGVFGGSAGLTYSKATSNLSVGGPLMVGGTIGVNGLGANSTIGIQSRGSTSGGYFASSVASGYASLGQGDYGVSAYGNSFGLYGSGGAYGVYGNGSSYGVYGNSNNTGVYGYGSIYGVYGTTSFAAADAGYFYNTLSGTYARLGYSTWAGYFGGNTYASGNETIAGTSTIGSNLRIGSNSSSDDDYIYFDDGSQYLEWENAMARFFMSSTLFVQGQITGTGGVSTISGSAISAADPGNQKNIRLRHDGTNGILDTNAPSGSPGNLVLQAPYAGTIVRVDDDLAITGGTIVGSVTNMGNGTLNASQLCISNDCRAAWPSSGGTPGGANTNVQFNNGGTFGGSAGLTYNSGTSALTVGGLLTAGSLTVDSLSGVLKASGGAVSGGATTSDLTEGANLYFTNARAWAANSATAPITYNAGTGAIGLSTPLAVSYGGTGGTDTPTAGGVPYGTGAKYSFTAAGTSGQFLQSNGAGAPSWATIPAGVSGSGTANYVAKFTAGTAVGNSQIYDNGAGVGIGTASPGANLILQANGRISASYGSGADASYRFGAGTENTGFASGAGNQIDFVTNGAQRGYFNSTGDFVVNANIRAGAGSSVVYRCATAGALPVGALTINAASCGTTADTGLRVK